MKKTILLIATALLVLPLPLLAQAGVFGDEIFSKCEEGAWLYYKILDEEEKTCQLQYLTYFVPKDDHHFDPYEGHVTIPESVYGYTVTELGNGNEAMFMSFACKVTSVTIPNTVRKINSNAFSHPSDLQSVEIPYGVKEICASAFADNYTITSAVIPGSVRDIGEAAFLNCKNLKTVTLSEGLETIGKQGFSECLSLDNVVVPNSVFYIGPFGFQSCLSMHSIVLPENLGVIESYMFNGCDKLESVEIPESVYAIGQWAFFACNSLRSLTIPAGVSYIGPEALAAGYHYNQFDVYSMIENPPMLNQEIVLPPHNPNYHTTLHVPAGKLDKYKNTLGWLNFGEYVEFDTTGIGMSSSDEESEVVTRYSLDGKQLKAPEKGLNIVRMSDGTVRKVVVK